MNNAQRILRGTLLLTGASFLMQTVGVSFNVWLTARLGQAGIGLFQLILTVYNFAVTLGCGGVRLAATRLTIEAVRTNRDVRHCMRRCTLYGLLCGTAMALVLFSLADVAARYWLHHAASALPLRMLAFSLPFVSMSSALTGFFTATQQVGRCSAVRISEQAVRIGIVFALMARLPHPGEDRGAVAVVTGMTLAEAFSCLCFFVLYNIEKKKYSPQTEKFTFGALLHIAVPDVSGAGARSALLTIEHLLIPRGFRRSGASADNALAVYGNVHGMVFPLLLYPSAILTSLAGLLVPELAGRSAQQDEQGIASIVRRVLQVSLWFGVGTAGVLYAFADGLSQQVYQTSDCAFFIRVLSPLVPVMYCDMTVDGMLKGLDQQRAVMRYNILDSGLCAVLVWLLLPRYAVKGYMFILFFSELLNFYLSIRRLAKVTVVEVSPGTEIGVPLCCILTASAFTRMLLIGETWNTPLLIAAILFTCGLYALLLYGFGCIDRRDAKYYRAVLTAQKKTPGKRLAPPA